MKQLMLGNEAVARGLYEAGCSFVSSYPGTPSTEITEYAAKYKEIYAEWAPNEKVAVEAAFGACVAGKRSFCSMKHVGLNVAADPVFTISYTGVNAGMIIGVADDAGMHSSQNEQDSRHYAIAAKLPMLEPADAGESLSFTKLAYEISEKYDTPVFIKMCTRVAHSQSIIETSERVETSKTYEKDGAKYIMMPGNAKRRHPIVEARTAALTEYVETAPFNRIEDGSDHSIGIITSSTSYQYAKEVCGDKYPVLKLGMINPLPVKKIQDFAKSVDKVIVIEELDGIIETHCRNIGVEVTGKELFSCIDELSQNIVAEKLGLPPTVERNLTKTFLQDLRLCVQDVRTEAFSIRLKRISSLFSVISDVTHSVQFRRLPQSTPPFVWVLPFREFTASTKPTRARVMARQLPLSVILHSCTRALRDLSISLITNRIQPLSFSITQSRA